MIERFLAQLKALSQHAVFWVIVSLALVISPHIERFPAWTVGTILLLFLWRLITIKHLRLRPSKWLLFLITLLSCAGIYLSFGTVFGKTAGSVLLSILLAIKLHESYSKRDYMLAISLSFFIIITNFLFSQSIPTVLFMLFTIIVLVISMISINQENAKIKLRTKAELSIKLLAQALPLMLIMFVLFPRIPGPLWQLPEEKQIATTGLSDTMSPGNISQLIQSNAVAFRVDFTEQTPEQSKLYWRSLVLWHFDGRTWEQGNPNKTPNPTLEIRSQPVSYTITMEPHQKRWLYALDMPVEKPDDIIYTRNFVLYKREKIDSLYQYKVNSSFDYIIQREISPWEKSAGLKLPANSNTRTIELGRKLAMQYQQPQEIINHVLAMFNRQNYYYTLKPPLTPGFNPVDQFLFDTKKGFCEHYASSFVLLLRAANIPARIVLGYQGGTSNPINNIITVRQSDAHAWAEVWQEGQGWVRYDPTAAIAPQRIEQNLDAALSLDESRPLHMKLNSGLIRDALFYWDAIDNQWNQWVVGYNQEQQQAFLEKLLNQDISFSDLVNYMIAGLLLLVLITSLMIIKPWHKQKLNPIDKIYQQFCHKLARAGVERARHEGPMDFKQRAMQEIPEQKDHIQLIMQLYIRLQYEVNHNADLINQFREHSKNFKVKSKRRKASSAGN